jgi:RNA-directed DNA polymerase
MNNESKIHENQGQVRPLATPTGEAEPQGTVERSVWTDRMMACLLKGGPDGGKWFSLHDKVFSAAALRAGYALVARNDGAPGIDHVSTEAFGKNLEKEISQLIADWRAGTYRAQSVKRTWIPKPGSTEKRPLGIPTVRDRVVQAALRLVLEPIFEQSFHPRSYGFRPGHRAQDAAAAVLDHLKTGRLVVVDADLKAYFDSIPHGPLLQRVREKVTDGRIIDLIDQFLKAKIMDELHEFDPEAGTPQGGVISPLLANIYLNDLDWHASSNGWEMVRYADDFVILCRTGEEAERALEMVRAWTVQAGLTLHPTKTRTVDMNQANAWFDFLGFRFKRHDKDGQLRILRLVRDKSENKIRSAIRERTKRNASIALTEIIRDLNASLRGWFGYYRSVHRSVHRELDQMVRRRLRSIQSRRHGRVRWGCGDAHRLWPNAFFAQLGLFSLENAHVEYCHSRRGNR